MQYVLEHVVCVGGQEGQGGLTADVGHFPGQGYSQYYAASSLSYSVTEAMCPLAITSKMMS